MADIRTAAQREIRLDHLLGTFTVGSKDHSWTDEYTELTEKWPGKMHILVTDIRAHGIREPILLGSDGRVWDGHHRICAAMHIGLDTVPVEFCSPARVTPTREQVQAVLERHDFEGFDYGECRCGWDQAANDNPDYYAHVAGALAVLMVGLTEGASK